MHGRMAPIMSHFSLEQGLLGCCSSCHTVFGDELTGKSFGSRERHFPFTGSRGLPLPAAVASARGGDERADWTPRAALASGHPPMGASPRTMLATPPPSLLVDHTPGRRSTTPPARDPAAKAVERARLRKLVNDFSKEAAAGRPCLIIVMDGNMVGSFGPRREARYILSEEVDRLSLDWKIQVGGDADEVAIDTEWQPIGMWPLEAILGTHRAEESALVQSCQRELSRLVSREELSRAAILEFSGGGSAARKPLLLIEETPEHRERFVSGMQILRLYKGAAQRLESARSAGDKRPAYSAHNGLLKTSPAVNSAANSHEGAGETEELASDGLIAQKA